MKRKNILLSLCVLLTVFFIISIGSSIKTDAKESSSIQDQYKYYTSIYIEEGDSLWTLAKQYAYEGISTTDYINELKKINSLDSDTIHSGCYLLVSYYMDEYIE